MPTLRFLFLFTVVGRLILAAVPAAGGTVSLSPAAVPLAGAPGSSTAQVLTLRNDTDQELSFALEAKDVLIVAGRRVWSEPGAVPASVAATAVFAPSTVTVPPQSSRSVELRVTLPAAHSPRALVALFRGTSRLGQATVSLGTLLTFAQSAERALDPVVTVQPQTATANLRLEVSWVNPGSEPLVAKGVAVLLDERGAIVGKLAMAPQRLLPGERSQGSYDYAGELPAGRYRALSTFEFDGQAVTRTTEFRLP